MFVNAGVFTLEPDGKDGTAIKSEDNQRYLSLTVNGVGVPDLNPTFTSIHASGGSVANIMVCIM